MPARSPSSRAARSSAVLPRPAGPVIITRRPVRSETVVRMLSLRRWSCASRSSNTGVTAPGAAGAALFSSASDTKPRAASLRQARSGPSAGALAVVAARRLVPVLGRGECHQPARIDHRVGAVVVRADLAEIDGLPHPGPLEQIRAYGHRCSYSASLRIEHLKWIWYTASKRTSVGNSRQSV